MDMRMKNVLFNHSHFLGYESSINIYLTKISIDYNDQQEFDTWPCSMVVAWGYSLLRVSDEGGEEMDN